MRKSPAERVCDRLDQPETFNECLALAQKFVRQPSVSGTGEGIREMAELVRATLSEELGVEAKVYETPGHPIVMGGLDVGAEKTVLFYGMYDVQPVEETGWKSPAYECNVVADEEFGDCVIGRGIFNSKGPLANTITALKLYKEEHGTFPVNLKFCIEGEEELGSPSLPAFLKEHAEELACDEAYFSFYSDDSSGKTMVYLGAKGMVFAEISSEGGEWGGPADGSRHGAYFCFAHNPAWVLLQALNTLIDRDQKTLRIDGIYDKVREPDEKTRKLLDAFEGSGIVSRISRDLGAKTLKPAASESDFMLDGLLRPSINIDGIETGYMGEGNKTILPHIAKARIDIRLVPDMDALEVAELLKAHFVKEGFGDTIQVKIQSAYPCSSSSVDDPANAAWLAAYKHLGANVEVWPIIPGTAPFQAFEDYLGVKITTGGLGFGGRQHNPNEFVQLEGMRKFTKSVALFLEELAK